MIVMKNICKAFDGRKVLNHVDLQLPIGITTLAWPSGRGKTTLIRILLGLETADEGFIEGAEGLRFGVVFQENRLLEQLSCKANLSYALGKAYDEKRAGELLAALGLELSDPKRVRDYSGGMKRRLAFARALLFDPDVLVLDEPFTGLDAENIRIMNGLIEEYANTRPVLLVSHQNKQ